MQTSYVDAPFGFMASQMAAFHVPLVKSLSLSQPPRMPRFLLGLSDPSGAKVMGAWNTFTPQGLMSLA